MNIRQQMDPLASFKNEIESMFQQSFQELSLKNNLNRTQILPYASILNNLMEAAKDQEQKIATLDRNLESLKGAVLPDTSNIRNQVNRQEQQIYDNFNGMMSRLNQVEEGITKARKNLEGHLRSNAQINDKMNHLTGRLQQISKQQGSCEYRGTHEDLEAQMEDFQKLLSQLENTNKSTLKGLDFGFKTQIQEPLNTFETKMMLHNRNNEEILRGRLREFTQRLKKLEGRIEDTTKAMNGEFSRSTQEQKRVIEEMNLIEGQMQKLRGELEVTEQRRRQAMQSSAASLDNLVEEMLSEAKKLQVRVQSLRKGYQQQQQKVGKR